MPEIATPITSFTLTDSARIPGGMADGRPAPLLAGASLLSTTGSFSTTAASGRRRCFRLQIEPLEGRALLSLTPIDFTATITSQPVVMNGTPVLAVQNPDPGDRIAFHISSE